MSDCVRVCARARVIECKSIRKGRIIVKWTGILIDVDRCGWMDGWVDGWVDGYNEGRMSKNKWTDG